MNRNFIVTLAGLAVIFAAVIFCIWPGMQAPLFTDDIHELERVSHFDKITDVFQPDVFGFYRPVKNALFMAAAPLQKNLMAWHLIGLIAYLAAIVAVYRIASIFLGSRRAAWIACCLWALSPTCVSTGVWLSSANISIGLVFTACVFHFHERWANHSDIGPPAASLIFFALALLCYESMIAIPALLFIRDLQQRRIGFDRQSYIRFGLYALVAVAFLIVRHLYSAHGIGARNFHPGFAPDTQAWHLSVSAPWFLWRHFLMWIFPFGKLELLGSYAWMRSASPASLAFGWAFLLALVGSAAWTWKRFPVISCGLLIFVVASLPAGNFIPNFNGPINDVYVTIPSIGLVIALAASCEILITQFVKRRREAEAGSFVILATLCIFLVLRIPVCGAYFRYWAGVWTNPTEMMLLSSETRPYQFQPKSYVSVLLLSAGYVEDAERIAHEVIREAPWHESARLTLAKIAEYHEDYATAEIYYHFILDSKTVSVLLKEPALLDFAKMLAKNPARREDAAKYFREYLQSSRNGKKPEAIAMLSQIYKEEGNVPKARATLERGLSLHPRNTELAKLLDAMGHPTPQPSPTTH